MKIINIIIKIFKSKAFLIFLGFIFLSYYIWFRFIRERLPKDIPFTLTFTSLIILIYICIYYFYLIIKLLKPKNQSQFISQILTFLQSLTLPFIMLEEYIRNNKYIKNIYAKFITKSLKFIYKFVINLKTTNILETINNYIIIIITFSKILFLILFLIDLYNDKLHFIYIYIYLQIIPLIIFYYIYLLKLFVQNKIKELSLHYMVEITSKDTATSNFFTEVEALPFDEDFTSFDGGYIEDPYPLMELEKFITLQTSNIQFDIYDLYEYQCYIKWCFKEQYAKKYGIIDTCKIEELYLKDKKILIKEFDDWMPLLIYNYLWLDIYSCFIYNKIRQNINIIIYISYLIIWSYILTVSLHTFNFTDIELQYLERFQEIYEPFSDTKL